MDDELRIWERLASEFRFAHMITTDIILRDLPDEEALTMLADSLNTISRLAEEVAQDIQKGEPHA